jgi:FkbM family methyltransferase
LRVLPRFIQGILARLGYRLVRHGFLASSRFGIDPVHDVKRLLADPEFAAHLPFAGVECVFDVGANVGDTAVHFAEAFPEATIYAFEPVPSTYEKRSGRVGEHPRVQTSALALGARSGEVTLHLFDGSVFASAVNRHAIMSADTSVGVTTVPMDSIDAWCSARAIDRIGFVYFEFFRVVDGGHGEEGGLLLDIDRHLTGVGYRLVAFYTDFVSSAHTGGIYTALYMHWRT